MNSPLLHQQELVHKTTRAQALNKFLELWTGGRLVVVGGCVVV
jgi:hypothetical protein